MYVAARFDADDLPEVLTLGDGSVTGDGRLSFLNSPLEEGVAYRVFTRAVVVVGDGNVLYASSPLSEPLDVSQVAVRAFVQQAELKQVSFFDRFLAMDRRPSGNPLSYEAPAYKRTCYEDQNLQVLMGPI